MGISDRVIVMCEGHIRAEFNRADFSERKLLAAAAICSFHAGV